MPLNCIDVRQELGFVYMEMPTISAYEKIFPAFRKLADRKLGSLNIGFDLFAVPLDVAFDCYMVGSFAFLKMTCSHSRFFVDFPFQALLLMECIQAVVFERGMCKLGGERMNCPTSRIFIISTQLKWLNDNQDAVKLIHLLTGFKPEYLFNGYIVDCSCR